MAKIAIELKQALVRREVDGTPGHPVARMLAQGDGWTVEDLICTSGPRDRPFEERHSQVRIAIVLAGSFQYRGSGHGRDGRTGGELMTPGSLLLGSAGRSFECRHDHDAGDRCLSFGYAADYFERLAAAAGARRPDRGFGAHRVPPLRALSPPIARGCALLSARTSTEDAGAAWEELGVRLAAQALELAGGNLRRPSGSSPGAVARVTRTVRMIERHPEARLSLSGLAQTVGLSSYHFLRIFEQVTGTTPHRYILGTRLREAATRLAADSGKVVDIAFDCGFGDVSNFNRTFRAEFGVSPRDYRRQSRPGARGAAGFTALSAHGE